MCILEKHEERIFIVSELMTATEALPFNAQTEFFSGLPEGSKLHEGTIHNLRDNISPRDCYLYFHSSFLLQQFRVIVNVSYNLYSVWKIMYHCSV